MRHVLWIACALSLLACKSDSTPDDGGSKPNEPAKTGKLDRPDALARPPSGGLPADLRPPR